MRGRRRCRQDTSAGGMPRTVAGDGRSAAGAVAIEMGTLGGFPNPPALWLRRAEPAYANADLDPDSLRLTLGLAMG